MPPEPFKTGAAGWPDQPRRVKKCHEFETDLGDIV
jgi:hypothetical protein